MSTLLYGFLTTGRTLHGGRESTIVVQEKGIGAGIGESGKNFSKVPAGPTGSRVFIDALAALLPAEAIALHAALVPLFLKTGDPKSDDSSVTITTTVSQGDVGFAAGVYVFILLLTVLLYVIARRGHAWQGVDYVRMLIPPAAFTAWTMLQRNTLFDAVFYWVPISQRMATAIMSAVVLALLAWVLAYKRP